MTRSKVRIKRLTMTPSEKGGVGKSFCTISLVDYLRAAGATVAAYDADGAVGSLTRVLGTRDDHGKLLPAQDPVLGVGYYNIRAGGERNLLLDSVARADEIIVHDLAGGTLRDVTMVVDGGEGVGALLDAYDEHNYRLTIVHVLSPTAASVQSVNQYLMLFGDRVDHVAVKNRYWGTKFPFWSGFTDGAGVRRGGKTRELFASLGGVEIEMPALANETYAKMDAENLSPSQAVRSTFLTITERSQVVKFRRDFAAAIEPVRSLFGL
jgi:CobQ/CobB/MinD/ParA nucleotide binding domain